jgi:phage terminase large subunit
LSVLELEVAEVFEPLLKPARYKGAWGGRGSGKSHFFAERVVRDSIKQRGLRTVCVREVQKTLKQSSKLVIEDKIQMLGLGTYFNVLDDRIETPGDGLIIFNGMQDHNAESIKSLEGFHRAWLEEAQTVSKRSLTLLRPTIRVPGSQIWASWNPRRKTDAIDEFLRKQPPADAIVVNANWRDNPWWNHELETERLHDQRVYPDQYRHVWEGDYVTIFEGAYYAAALHAARADGRIGHVARDELAPLKLVWDIGGPGQSADAMAIWVCQFIGMTIRVIDYIEGVGQVLSHYINELRERKYGTGLCIIPHDAAQIHADNPLGVDFEAQLRSAGFPTKLIRNQGRGAAAQRISAGRRLFPKIWFNEATTEAGRDALGAYHERRDEERQVGLGPEHDWSSHAADAFGLLCVAYEEPRQTINPTQLRPRYGTIA